ncbi:hypothetical protein TL10_25515 [Mycolicibacterium llatzerense]|uniref:Uncharacterized protein n=1 Tax=Mycolicibacterium llatzerense TaxID=280871 RepID=A0A0D1LE95_9MYCO|nr:hypothetical protein TL10_25515 [Mycolicibacterium llatzerense]MCT7372564.1 hypothetical protein [Mycolicibacterium llatzerense]
MISVGKYRLVWLGFLVLGLVVGVGFWFLVTFVLAAAGFSFYALHIGSYVALVLWLIAGPLIYIRVNRAHPHTATYRIAPLLLGMGLVVTYFAVAWAISHG